MQFLEIFIYSLIQGITEFLPISSSAHLYFLDELFKWKGEVVLYALAAHLGTLIAVIYYKKKYIFSLFKNILIFKDELKYFVCIFVSCIPVIIIGAIISLFFEDIYDSILLIIGTACILGGILLDFADKYKEKEKVNTEVTYKISFLVGFFQILALIPGMSRSGTVLTALRMCYINRQESIKFSILTGIPILFIASFYSLYTLSNTDSSITYKFFTISIISFFSALLSIRFIVFWVSRYSFRFFSLYRIILGLAIYFYLII